jgi:phenylacetate-CoA ligase
MSGLKERLYDRLPVGIQNAVVSRYGRTILKERFGPEFERWSEFLERSERFGRDELGAYQDERLRETVRHAYETVPYYRGLFDALRLKPSDIAGRADLPKLPILSREVVAREGERLLSTALRHRDIVRTTTSGTTNNPLPVFWDHTIAVLNNACLWRSRRWAGFEFGRPYATLMGRLIVPGSRRRPPFWRLNAPWNQLLLSPIHLTEETAPLYLAAMRERRVEALETYPSFAYVLARYAESEGEHLPLRAVFTTGEPLLALQRAVIEERFQCRVFDAYGQAERVVFSSECEEHCGHHLYEEYGITELVDGDGNPVADGALGRIVATGLHNRAMPLLRYALGDVTSRTGSACRCGRELALFGGVTTKSEDIIVTADGRMLPATIMTGFFSEIRGTLKTQIVQESPDEIIVKLVVGDGFSLGEQALLERNLRQRLGPDMKIMFERVDDIPLSPRGKFRWVVSTVPLRWGATATGNLYQEDAPGSNRAGSGGPRPA